METKSVATLVTELKETISNYDMVVPADSILEMKIRSAIGAINNCRRFEPSDTILYDLKYEYKIIPLAIVSIEKDGAEGETQHSENGVIRTYGNSGEYPKEMLYDIAPLAKFK